MKPWRYPHLFTLWQDWLAHGQQHQLDQWLANWFKAHKQYGKKDRLAYADGLFSAMRFAPFAIAAEQAFSSHRFTLADFPVDSFWFWVLQRAGLLTQAPRELQQTEQRQQFFEQLQNTWPKQPPLSAEFLHWYGLDATLAAPLALRAQYAQWSEQQLSHFIADQSRSAPVWLRPQGMTATQLQAALQQEAIQTESAEGALKLQARCNISQSPLFLSGKIEIQDLASQQLARVVTPSAKQTVWDVCAGAGGKSLAIASQFPDCTITATDLRTNALKQLSTRAQRAQLNNISIRQHNACQPFTGQYDWVLIDAPCSSAGVWRRTPEAKFRLAVNEELLTLQANILANAAKHVKVGGYLVYATCSWRVEENEAQIKRFQQSLPNTQILEQTTVGLPTNDSDTMWFCKMQLGS